MPTTAAPEESAAAPPPPSAGHGVLGGAFAVLDAFVQADAGLGLTGLARASGLAKTSAYRLAEQLVGLGAEQRVDGRNYVGARVGSIGQQWQPDPLLRRAIQATVHALAVKSRAVASVRILHEHRLRMICGTMPHGHACMPNPADSESTARVAGYLPYDDLLPRTDVYVTNDGYGGAQYALRHGLPIVATGAKEDKPEVGARVAWSGTGLRLRTERPTPKALLREPRFRKASRQIAAEMRASGGLTALTDIVDQQLGPPDNDPRSASQNPAARGSMSATAANRSSAESCSKAKEIIGRPQIMEGRRCAG